MVSPLIPYPKFQRQLIKYFTLFPLHPNHFTQSHQSPHPPSRQWAAKFHHSTTIVSPSPPLTVSPSPHPPSQPPVSAVVYQCATCFSRLPFTSVQPPVRHQFRRSFVGWFRRFSFSISKVYCCYKMADIMGHGGDGDEEPPHFGGLEPGGHEIDPVPKKVRGKNKGLNLEKALSKNNGRPLKLDFDRNATWSTVGGNNDMFIREASRYISLTCPFDKKDWKHVPQAEKDAVMAHLVGSFDIESVRKDPRSKLLLAVIDVQLAKRYRDKKALAKKHFLKVGGYDDVEGAKDKPPLGMHKSHWAKAVDFFDSDDHRKISKTNKAVRKNQKFPYRGGSSTYSSSSFKNSWNRADAFLKAHTSNGAFVSEEAEQQYDELVAEYKSQVEDMGMEMDDSTDLSQLDHIAIFEKVMGKRPGYVRGLGRKPPSTSSISLQDHRPPQSTPPQFTQEEVKNLFQDPAFMKELAKHVKMKGQVEEDSDDLDDSDYSNDGDGED